MKGGGGYDGEGGRWMGVAPCRGMLVGAFGWREICWNLGK